MVQYQQYEYSAARRVRMTPGWQEGVGMVFAILVVLVILTLLGLLPLGSLR